MEAIVSTNGASPDVLAAVTDAQKSVLTQETPAKAILTRQGKGGKSFRYVTQAWVTRQLNLAFGWAWSFEVTAWQMFPAENPAEVFVQGRLTVHTPRGDLTKEQFGQSDVKRSGGAIMSIGDDLKSAASDALKKCASLLGVALDLYEKDDMPDLGEAAGSSAAEAEFDRVGQQYYGNQWPAKRDGAVQVYCRQNKKQTMGDDDYRALVKIMHDKNIASDKAQPPAKSA